MTYFCLTCQDEHPGLPTLTGRCKSCVHWRGIPADHRYANQDPNLGQCHNPRLTQDFKGEDAVSTQGDGYYGPLWTGPYFACIHHEQKP